MHVTCSFSSAWKSGLESWWVIGLGLNRHIRAQRVNIKLSTAHTQTHTHKHKHTHTHTHTHTNTHKHTHTHTHQEKMFCNSVIQQLNHGCSGGCMHCFYTRTSLHTFFCTCMHHSMSILHTKMCVCMQVFFKMRVLKIGDWLHSHCWDEFPFFYFFLACHVRHHQCAGKPEATML